jgi:hypothetical protein
VVQRLGDQVFAGPVFAFNQDGRGFAGSHAAEKLEQVAHGVRFGDDLALGQFHFPSEVFERGDYALQPTALIG